MRRYLLLVSNLGYEICVVGLNCLGLPRAIQFARSGVTVVGLDVDQVKVDAINESAELHQADRARHR
jgi:UDP-N-acetyl-D-mannosaminuronate dehydrogenase